MARAARTMETAGGPSLPEGGPPPPSYRWKNNRVRFSTLYHVPVNYRRGRPGNIALVVRLIPVETFLWHLRPRGLIKFDAQRVTGHICRAFDIAIPQIITRNWIV